MAARELFAIVDRRKSMHIMPPEVPDSAGVHVITCLMFGSRGCGKTTMLQTFAGCAAPKLVDGAEAAARSAEHKAIRLLPADDSRPQTVRDIPLSTLAAEQYGQNFARS